MFCSDIACLSLVSIIATVLTQWHQDNQGDTENNLILLPGGGVVAVFRAAEETTAICVSELLV